MARTSYPSPGALKPDCAGSLSHTLPRQGDQARTSNFAGIRFAQMSAFGGKAVHIVDKSKTVLGIGEIAARIE